MSIRSVDMQVLVQKAGDVARVQQTHQIEQDRRQQEFNHAIIQQTNHNTKEVNQTLKGEDVYVQDRQEKQKKQKKDQENKGNEETTANNENKSVKSPKQGHHLDITI